MRVGSLLVVLSGALVLGCADQWNETLRPKLVERAAFDMDCQATQLQLVPLGEHSSGLVTTYGVTGCGKRATYVLNAQTQAWVLNSPTEPSRPSSPAAATPPAP